MPLIAVPGRPQRSARVGRTPGVSAGRPYLEALERAGGIGAVVLPTDLRRERVDELVARFDGLLLMGGGDVSPARYGAVAAPEVVGVDDERDAVELALVQAALEAGLPVLAICRGAQLLNVALGGTLDQHITGRPGTVVHNAPTDAEDGAVHEVHVIGPSRLADALGQEVVVGSSYHHQAIDRLGRGLRVVARAPDGVVEGIELDEGWVVGVQWHPEDTAPTDPVQQRLFDVFVGVAAVPGFGALA